MVTYRFSIPEPLVRVQIPHPDRKVFLSSVIIIGKERCCTAETVTAASLLTETGELVVTGLPIVWNIITGNVVLTIMVGASLLSLGFAFYRKAKRAAR